MHAHTSIQRVTQDLEHYIDITGESVPTMLNEHKLKYNRIKESTKLKDMGRLTCAAVLQALTAGMSPTLLTVVTFTGFPTSWAQAVVQLVQELHHG
jgi:hypothetical protein